MGDSKPPSRERYERENPTVSFRISREAKQKLDQLVDGLETTKKAWFENIIEDEKQTYDQVFAQGKTKGRDEGYEEGFEDGLAEGSPTVPCMECGEPVDLTSQAERDKLYEAIEKLQQFSSIPPEQTHRDLVGFRHVACR